MITTMMMYANDMRVPTMAALVTMGRADHHVLERVYRLPLLLIYGSMRSLSLRISVLVAGWCSSAGLFSGKPAPNTLYNYICINSHN